MCLLKTKVMDLPHSIVLRLQYVMQRQSAFCNQLNLKDLSQAEFEHYSLVRELCVQFIKDHHEYFGTQADTFATALGILDVFLWKVKVTEKHTSIVSGACFFIAAKMLEVEDKSPTAHEMAKGRRWTDRDLCRMELRVLSGLSWHVPSVTYLSFLPVLADIYGLDKDQFLSRDVVSLAGKFLEQCSTVLVQPTVLAVALMENVNGEMEKSPAELQIRVHCNIDDAQLSRCKKALSHMSAEVINTPPPPPPRLSPKFPMKIFDKPSMSGVTPLYTIAEETPAIQT